MLAGSLIGLPTASPIRQRLVAGDLAAAGLLLWPVPVGVDGALEIFVAARLPWSLLVVLLVAVKLDRKSTSFVRSFANFPCTPYLTTVHFCPDCIRHEPPLECKVIT